MSLAEKLFGSFSDRELKKINPLTKQVLALEGKYQAMPDAELQAQTPALKQKLADGKTLDDILPDAFAVCREAAWRVLGMKHFPVQVTGGIALHRGDIAEMQTGEGKTLVATLPAYLNALTGEGVHIVTVNDYLAKRDSEWMGKVHRFLGLSVGLIVHGLNNDERREAYNCDITYGTNNEMGFDYLRDNMALYKENMVQRGHAFAIVDEVDSILIDEARTPLIISGMGEKSTEMYSRTENLVRGFRKKVIAESDDKEEEDVNIDADYIVDEKAKTATLTARGVKKAEEYFGLENIAENCARNFKGDCGVQALLFITLCRCAGIPARWQSGLCAEPNDVGMHDWAMFYVAPHGWMFADPSYGGGAHRAGNEARRVHYFGNLDPYRMVANCEFRAPLDPPKAHWRHDPYDNQAGEIEYEDRGLRGPEYERDMEMTQYAEL